MSGEMDEAWAAAEAALPKRPDGGVWDRSGGVGLSLHRITKNAYLAEWGAESVAGDTPVDALRKLAARLTEMMS